MYRILTYLYLCFNLTSCVFITNEDRKHSENSIKNRRLRSDSVLANAIMDKRDGNRIDLKDLYGKMLNYDSTSIDNYLLYGCALITSGNKNQGLNTINIAINKYPNESFGYFIKGMAIAMVYPDVRDSVYYYCNKALQIDPNNSYYYLIRAQLYNEDRLYSKSISDLDNAIKLKPNDLNLYVHRGIVRTSGGEYKEALDDLKIIPASQRDNFHAYLSKASSQIKLKKYLESIMNSDTAIYINPNFAKAFLIRATAKSNIDDYDGAYEDLKKGTELGDPECKELLQQMKEYNKTHKTL